STARTRAAALHRSQRSAAVNFGLVNVPGMTPPNWPPLESVPGVWSAAPGWRGRSTLSDESCSRVVPLDAQWWPVSRLRLRKGLDVLLCGAVCSLTAEPTAASTRRFHG